MKTLEAPGGTLFVDEFFQMEDELCDPKAVVVLGMLGGGDA